MSAILWFVHDHGHGHLSRARAVIPHLSAEVIVAAGPRVADAAASVLTVPVVALPADAAHGRAWPRGPWHHAPADAHQRARAGAIAELLDRRSCTTVVADVSMEVATLSCLLGRRTVALRQSGRRDDDAHRIGLASADAVWAPQHRDLEPLTTAADERWHFTGMFSRFDGCNPPRPTRSRTRCAVVVLGAGGTRFDSARWRRAAAPRGWRVVIAGASERWSTGTITSLGVVDDIGFVLGCADLVIGSAGWGTIADAAALRCHLAVVPEDRPFDEQRVRAERLARHGLAVALPAWPEPDDLDAVLDAALALAPNRWDCYHDGRGAQRSAQMLEQVHSS